MVQVSRNPLNAKINERIFEIFTEVVAALSKPAEIQDFLNDLLSPTEKIMLGKRLSIAYLILKGYDQRTICSMLKVSSGTVSRVSFNLQIKGKGYKGIFGKVFAKEKIAQTLDKLDQLLSGFLPPPRGTNWSEWRKREYKERFRKIKPF